MRIRISHLTSYRYETPATSVIQMLRLTPRNHDGQYVARWRIDVSTDCRLDQHEADQTPDPDAHPCHLCGTTPSAETRQ